MYLLKQKADLLWVNSVRKRRCHNIITKQVTKTCVSSFLLFILPTGLFQLLHFFCFPHLFFPLLVYNAKSSCILKYLFYCFTLSLNIHFFSPFKMNLAHLYSPQLITLLQISTRKYCIARKVITDVYIGKHRKVQYDFSNNLVFVRFFFFSLNLQVWREQ